MSIFGTLNGQSPPQDECLERYRNRWTSGFSSTHCGDIISEIMIYSFCTRFFWKIFIELPCKKKQSHRIKITSSENISPHDTEV